MTLLRTLLALVVVLFAPGYLILRALFPSGGPRDAERLALTIGLSLAVSVSAGLILQLTPGKITEPRVDWLLGAIILALALVAAVRVRRAHPAAATQRERRTVWIRLWLVRGVPLLFAAALGVVAIAIARHGAIRVARRSAFTQLWLLPRAGGAELGVASFEHGRRQFTITVTAGRKLLDRAVISLDAGATYTHDIAVASRQSPTGRIQARLFLGDSTVAYRQVSWTPQAGSR
jgi:small-conductance mechanosensitive channel